MSEITRPLEEHEIVTVSFDRDGSSDPMMRLIDALGIEGLVSDDVFAGAADFLTEELTARLGLRRARNPVPELTTFVVTTPSPYNAPSVERSLISVRADRYSEENIARSQQLSARTNELESPHPELEDYLRTTYGRLLQTVETRLGPDARVYLIDRPLVHQAEVGQRRVWTLIGAAATGAVLKLPRQEIGDTYRVYMERLAALRKLYSLERSPYISYQIRETDGNNTIEDHIESFETARSLAVKGRLRDAIRLVRDAILGADFLVQNGLRLTDIKPDNIRKNPLTGNGQLFDFDSLVTESHELLASRYAGSYLAPLYRHPPERRDADAKYEGGAIDESEMSYELGYTVGEVMELVAQVKATPDNLNIDLLEHLKLQMTARNPNSRPKLAAAAKQLDDWLNNRSANPEAKTNSKKGLVARALSTLLLGRPKH